MKKSISIQLKAALLLIVFSMNTVIGLGCAMGVDMSFKTTHHHEEDAATESAVHQDADGIKHQHHDEATKHHHDSKEDLEKGGCCNDGVMKFQSLDKTLAQNVNPAINAPVFVVLLSRFAGIDIFRQSQDSHHKYIIQFFRPPPPDIRILIQSFQI